MVVKRRKKFRRMRGSRECGHGIVHRGAGCRGGVGKAGSGKRAKAKMPQRGLWTIQEHGKRGFKFKGYSVDIVPINLKVVEGRLESWIKDNKVVKEGNVFVVDLPGLGFNKLLGAGHITHKLKIIVDFASKNVVEKVKAAGGEVVLPQPKEPVQSK